jgi:hypothetical protein
VAWQLLCRGAPPGRAAVGRAVSTGTGLHTCCELLRVPSLAPVCAVVGGLAGIVILAYLAYSA